jgi:sporulation protein YlmC with PRC-barrel domain
MMESGSRQLVTREQIIGMQVINSQAKIIGRVKDLSLVVGETDQALIIRDEDAHETIVRWSDVLAIADVILLRGPAGPGQAATGRCPHCGAALEPGAVFCGECGKKV